MKRLFLSAVTAMCSVWMLGAGLSVTNLRVDGVVNPVGVDREQPLLSWSVYDSDLKGVEQTTFQVQIYSDARCTKRVWNSRSQRSTDSWILAPALNGEGTRYYWRVTCWDNKGRQVISKTATFVTGLNGNSWEGAQWLKGNRQSWDKQDGATVLRKKINLTGKKKIELARVFAASLGVFDLYVNGERVGYEDPDGATQYAELKPGWTNYDKEIPYMTFDVTDMVKKGENMLGVQLTNGWWGGEISGNHYPADRQLGFMAKVFVMYADSTVETFITDPSWEQNQCGPLLYGDIYNGETYDARRDYSWTTLSDATTGWKPAETMTAPTDSIYAFEGPLVVIRNQYQQSVKKVTIWEGTKQTGTTHGEINVKSTLDNPSKMGFVLHKGETAIFDMGQNMVGWPLMTVKGNSGAEITCRFGEMLNDDGSEDHINDGPAGSVWTHNMRTAKTTLRYILSGNPKGETYHPSTTFFGFRYISMTASEDVTIMNLVGQVVGSDINEGATFECSDPSVNQLFKNIQWGARGNFLSIPTDCPQRDERLGWSGDTQMFSRTACYNADMRAFYHKWMRDLRSAQREDGAVPDVAPLGRYGDFGNAAWGDAIIIVPWNVYLMYNDTEILDENYEAMQRYMLWLQSNTDEQYFYNGAGTAYGDWLAYEELDKRFVSVCYYAHVAELMARISMALGNEETDMYLNLASAIREEFQKRYVVGGHLTEKSQSAYVLALHFNMLEYGTQYENAVRDLREKIEKNDYCLSTGFVGTAYLCPTLSEYGMTDLAYDLLLQHKNPSWLYSVDNGATTVWERWDSFKAGEGFNKHEWNMNSFNHYAYGVIAEWMFRDMLGMSPDHEDPGFHHIVLAPKPDMRTDDQIPAGQKRIDWARGSIPTPYGTLTSSWERGKDGKIKYSFIIPYNTKATFTQLHEDGTTEEHELTAGKWSF